MHDDLKFLHDIEFFPQSNGWKKKTLQVEFLTIMHV